MKKMGLVQTNKDLSLRKKPRQARLSSQETAPTPTSATNKRHKSALVQSLADLASRYLLLHLCLWDHLEEALDQAQLRTQCTPISSGGLHTIPPIYEIGC